MCDPTYEFEHRVPDLCAGSSDDEVKFEPGAARCLHHQGWTQCCIIVLQKVQSEDDPEVRNHGEGPY